MPKIFDQIKVEKPRMSAFDLSREQKLSCKMGELVPTYLEEVVPGDQFRVDSEVMLRMAPMLAPVMHRINVFMHYFFVPNRLVWNQWEDFITGGQQGDTAPAYPDFAIEEYGSVSTYGRLMDFMGLPDVAQSGSTNVIQVSQLPFRAYVKIWNDYYRDETLQDEIDVDIGLFMSGHEDDILTMKNRCWEKDYLTSALPFPQRGDASKVPIQDLYSDTSRVKMANDGTNAMGDSPLIADDGSLYVDEDGNGVGGSIEEARIENLAANIGININDLRKSTAIQRFLEKQARGGYRYIETILNHFGVRSSDTRLQRPEYLGGGKQNVVISEVLNTAGQVDDAGEPLGEPTGSMAGHGIAVGKSNTFQEQFEEHGYVMGIMSILPKTAYQDGIPRHFLRNDKYDYYWPEFANLGEQEVSNVEVYYSDVDDDYNGGIFGYQQRYAEYKYGRSTVHGDFRDSLDFWHMGRIFDDSELPALNEDFVRANPTERIFAVTEDDHLWIQLYHSVKARRPMPYFSDPSLT